MGLIGTRTLLVCVQDQEIRLSVDSLLGDACETIQVEVGEYRVVVVQTQGVVLNDASPGLER